MYVNNQGKSRSNKRITYSHCVEQILMMPAVIRHDSSHRKSPVNIQEGRYPKHDLIQHPNAPSKSEDLAERSLVRAAEIGDTFCKDSVVTLHTENAAGVNLFIFCRYFPLGFFKWFLCETALVTSGVLKWLKILNKTIST